MQFPDIVRSCDYMTINQTFKEEINVQPISVDGIMIDPFFYCPAVAILVFISWEPSNVNH